MSQNAFALHIPFLWPGAGDAGVEYLARRRLSLSAKRQDHPRSSVVAAHRRVFGRRAGGAISDDKSSESGFHGEGYRKIWARLRFAGASREPSPRATSHGRARLTRAPLHRTV